MRIVLSDHCAERYWERVRPAVSRKQARRELEALVRAGGATQTEKPWFFHDGEAECYLIVSDGICLALKAKGSVLLATTCLTRGERSEGERAAKNERRRKRAMARKTRAWHEKHSYNGRPPREEAA